MEKAYDLKALAEKLKVHGLDVAEEGAKAITEAVIDWVSESAGQSATLVDNLLVPVLAAAKPMILSLEDKIDGKVG